MYVVLTCAEIVGSSLGGFHVFRCAIPIWELEVAGCGLHGSIQQLLLPLAATPAGNILASGCHIFGQMPSLHAVGAMVDGISYATWYSVLASTLQVLDVSNNNLSAVPYVPAALRMDISKNSRPIVMNRSAFQDSVQRGVELWVTDTQLANPLEVQDLLKKELKLQEAWVPSKQGHACHELVAPTLRVTPEKFLPEEMCSCRPGYFGHGTQCSPCLKNTFSSEAQVCFAHFIFRQPFVGLTPSSSSGFKEGLAEFSSCYRGPFLVWPSKREDFNQSTCEHCPPDSNSTKEASLSERDCVCSYGSVRMTSSGWRCQCPEKEALVMLGEIN